MWHEWEPDPEAEMPEGPVPVLWCRGWTTSKDALPQAFYRFGFADDLGGGWRLTERAELRHTYLCTEDGSGDERTLAECGDDGVDPCAATLVTIRQVDH